MLAGAYEKLIGLLGLYKASQAQQIPKTTILYRSKVLSDLNDG